MTHVINRQHTVMNAACSNIYPVSSADDDDDDDDDVSPTFT